ncbi:MAG: ribulose-phosphate 3-epimerase [Sphaerochaeta sp.]
MKKLLCPSIMNLDTEDLVDQVKRLDAAETDIFHLDLMDGSFVPNFGMSLNEFKVVRRHTDKPLDVHMMVQNPIRYIRLMADYGLDIIYIHPESDPMPSLTLQRIRDMGKKAGLVINPGTSMESIRALYPLIDYLMIMTVNPGFCGQLYLPWIDQKIEQAVEERKPWGFPIVIDGGVDKTVMTRLASKGVEGFVLGRLILFDQTEKDYTKLMQWMRTL